MVDTVLVPNEGSPLSEKALKLALTDYPDAEVIVLYVMDPLGSGMSIIDVMRPKFKDGAPPGSVSPEYWREWRDRSERNAEEVFDDARAIAHDHERSITTVLEFGDPADVIIEYAEAHGVDRIVMGSHCRSITDRFLLGSVAETVVERAPAPVIIVR